MNQNNLSTVILTSNEEDNISRCLKSVIWCRDIILIDNSTDKTVEIARKIVPKNNLTIYRDNEQGDFSYLRNLGLQKAKCDWVMFLDADEEITKNLSREIIQQTQKNNCQGYFIRRQDYFLGKFLKHGETGKLKLLKLGRKNAGFWKRAVHEVWDIPGETGELKYPLLHFPHPTVSEFIFRVNRWTNLNAEAFHRQGKKAGFMTIIIYPIGKFISNYFIKLGFLDGMQGFFFAVIMSFHSFLTRAKLYFLQKNI